MQAIYASSDQSQFLLQFKKSIDIDNTASSGCDSNGVPSYRGTKSWNRSTDCCRWDGVTCNELSGEVIGLDLSCSQLHGVINSNSSLFQLSHLKWLNLACNDFSSSLISSVDFASVIPSNVSASLTILNLGSTNLYGKCPADIFQLPNLVRVELTNKRDLYGYLSDVKWNTTTSTLSYLALSESDLESNQLTGQLYDFQYQSIQRIYLSGNKLDGPVPKSVSKLVNLALLDLSSNNFGGVVQASMFSNCNQLQTFDLSNNNILLITDGVNSTLPQSVAFLFLSSCGIKDLDFLVPANNLYKLDPSENLLHGDIFSDKKGYNWSQRLFYLNLSYNSLIDLSQIPLPNLLYLDLSSCLLQGPVVIPPASVQVFMIPDNYLTGESHHQYAN
ncbi:receptor-like protein Cf-9 [Coffea eugenioides]|uniref:receptor-like protein Cf-9 n=1 Tax=Coffea eugenioides TaxID=49369 RepID=UPI000F615555|nr:receptor-like protein Cf-9 [Coffea eugenioides]